MLSQSEQANLNLEQARNLRASGSSYRDIGRQLAITSGQLGHIRRTLKREKGARTRLRSAKPNATDRDLPVSQSALPSGLRRFLTSSGYRTLGDLADKLADPDFRGLESMPGIGPYRARLVKGVLDQFGLLSGPSDLQAAIEKLFPELGHAPLPIQDLQSETCR
ncbi:hypothetical protein D3Y57_07495 [Sphingomonas paeninsulae]|jgi:hypothetical protein|uniref:Uncharacterized protein n=1 Tax=Sphingomonas paeninsulae TaxID=2319844 RepID=A0A494TJ75_SPHPE|nr:hypothetical protein D3Y57_07495 [Sphingomonas paeninsulae]